MHGTNDSLNVKIRPRILETRNKDEAVSITTAVIALLYRCTDAHARVCVDRVLVSYLSVSCQSTSSNWDYAAV